MCRIGVSSGCWRDSLFLLYWFTLSILTYISFALHRSRASLVSERSSPWTNSFHVQNGGRHQPPDHDDGGFLNNSGSQRGSFAAKRDSLASRDQISVQGALNTAAQQHHSNRDLTAAAISTSSLIPTNSLPRTAMEGSYTPRSYTPRADPNMASLPRNNMAGHTANLNSSLNRSHSSAKMDNPSQPKPMPRSHSNMDSLSTGKALAETPHQQQKQQVISSASLPRSMAMMVNGGANAPTSNGR